MPTPEMSCEPSPASAIDLAYAQFSPLTKGLDGFALPRAIQQLPQHSPHQQAQQAHAGWMGFRASSAVPATPTDLTIDTTAASSSFAMMALPSPTGAEGAPSMATSPNRTATTTGSALGSPEGRQTIRRTTSLRSSTMAWSPKQPPARPPNGGGGAATTAIVAMDGGIVRAHTSSVAYAPRSVCSLRNAAVAARSATAAPSTATRHSQQQQQQQQQPGSMQQQQPHRVARRNVAIDCPPADGAAVDVAMPAALRSPMAGPSPQPSGAMRPSKFSLGNGAADNDSDLRQFFGPNGKPVDAAAMLMLTGRSRPGVLETAAGIVGALSLAMSATLTGLTAITQRAPPTAPSISVAVLVAADETGSASGSGTGGSLADSNTAVNNNNNNNNNPNTAAAAGGQDFTQLATIAFVCACVCLGVFAVLFRRRRAAARRLRRLYSDGAGWVVKQTATAAAAGASSSSSSANMLSKQALAKLAEGVASAASDVDAWVPSANGCSAADFHRGSVSPADDHPNPAATHAAGDSHSSPFDPAIPPTSTPAVTLLACASSHDALESTLRSTTSDGPRRRRDTVVSAVAAAAPS